MNQFLEMLHHLNLEVLEKMYFVKVHHRFYIDFFEVKYIVSTLVEDRLMYSRPRYFEDKKEVSLET